MKSNQNQQIHLLGTERSKIACHHIEKLNHLSNAHFHNLKPPDTVSHESSKMQPVRCPKTGWCRFTPSQHIPPNHPMFAKASRISCEADLTQACQQAHLLRRSQTSMSNSKLFYAFGELRFGEPFAPLCCSTPQ